MESVSAERESVQARIERVMSELGSGGRWDGICLFSSDGLLMARQAESDDEAALLETAIALAGPVRDLKDRIQSPEIIVAGAGVRLVFRFFSAWEQDLILAAVIRQRKGFRRRLSRLVRVIQSLE
jgi:predicted regulator of Ras-like GTPase activity (Roadblock/LC7/MglB family)